MVERLEIPLQACLAFVIITLWLIHGARCLARGKEKIDA
jgi:hypothetical protein